MKGWYLLLLVALVCLVWAFMLGVDRESDNELMEGTYETIPVKVLKAKPFSLAEAKTEEPQKSFIVYLDPGHQAQANIIHERVSPRSSETKMKVTGGTTGVATGKPEYVLNLEAAFLLEELLTEKGFEVYLTRSTHDVDISNKERAEMANEKKADLVIRLHADGAESPNVSGFGVLVPSKEQAISKQSESAATLIVSEVKKQSGMKVNGIRYRSDLTGFNWSTVPVVLLEMGYMTNPEEDQKLSDPMYLEGMLEAVTTGVERYTALQ
ncbi:hypothetical protein CHN50_17440 [Priestia aryabhattai]|nr:hypothetical protein CHN50_17440 [Priestia aryabhattai]